MKWWQSVLLVFAGFFVLVGIISTGDSGGTPAKTDTEIQQEARDSIPLPDENETEEIEDYTPTPSKTINQIYDEVELGMTESEVRSLVGREPDLTNEIEANEFGNMLDLSWGTEDDNSLFVDNVSVTFIDGIVESVTIGEFDGNNDTIKSKM